MALYYTNQYVTTTLSKAGGLDASETSGLVLASIDGIETAKPGIALLDYQDPLDTSKAEWITYTTINGTTKELQGVTRAQEGSTGKAHDNGCAIAFPLSKSHIDNLNDAVHPDVNSYGLHNNSLYRQALINGNFDVWQRGVSFTPSGSFFGPDRWAVFRQGGVTGSTYSRQDGTGVNGSVYCIRVSRDSGNSATNSLELWSCSMEDASKLRGKKVTLSFWARKGANYSATSSYLTSKIRSGTTVNEATVSCWTGEKNEKSVNNVLTTSWQKFTQTSTDVLGSGVNNLGINFTFTPTGTAGATDYCEITQVQLCAGDVALPFMPKSFEEELRACQRYYQKSFPYATAPANAVGSYLGAIGVKVVVDGVGQYSTTWVNFPTRMRTTPSAPTFYNPISNNNKFYNRGASADSGAGATSYGEVSENGMFVENIQVAGDSAPQLCFIHYTVSAEL